ncbi:MAG: MlaD family protein, partial [Bacteroidota bacterium]
GHTVGKVDEIYLHPSQPGRIVVRFVITDPALNIPNNSLARIVSQDLLGSKIIEIELGNNTVYAESGDTLVAGMETDLKSVVEEKLRPIETKINNLIAEVDSVVSVITDVLDSNARANLSKSFENISNSFATFERTSLRLDSMVGSEKQRVSLILSHVESITSNIRKNNDELASIIQNFSSITDSLVKADLVGTISRAGTVMESVSNIVHKIENGEGTMGMLVNDEKLYMELTMAATELNMLLLDLRLNPGKYMPLKKEGKNPKKRKELVRSRSEYEGWWRRDSELMNARADSLGGGSK